MKLCPRLHVNPRSAEACARCGSHDLSIPQRHVSWLSKVLFWVLSIVPGLILLVLSAVYVVYYLYKLLSNPFDMLPTMLLGLALGLLWLAWIRLPLSLSRRLLGRRKYK